MRCDRLHRFVWTNAHWIKFPMSSSRRFHFPTSPSKPLRKKRYKFEERTSLSRWDWPIKRWDKTVRPTGRAEKKMKMKRKSSVWAYTVFDLNIYFCGRVEGNKRMSSFPVTGFPLRWLNYVEICFMCALALPTPHHRFHHVASSSQFDSRGCSVTSINFQIE